MKRIPISTFGTSSHIYSGFTAIVPSPDGSRIWFSLWDRQGVRDTKTGRPVAAPVVPRFTAHIRFRPDNQRLSSIFYDPMGVWSSDLAQRERLLRDPLWPELSAFRFDALVELDFAGLGVELGPDESRRTVSPAIWALGDPRRPHAALPPPDAEGIFIDAGLAALSYGDRLDVVDLATGNVASTLALEPKDNEKAFLASSGARAVIRSDTRLRVVDVASQRTLASWDNVGSVYDSVSTSPNGTRFVFTNSKETLLFDVSKPAPLALPQGPQRGALFASDDVLIVFDETAENLTVVDRAKGTRRVIPAQFGRLFAATPDGSRVFVDAEEGVVYDTIHGRASAPLNLRDAPISAARFSPNGRVLLVALGRLGQIRLYGASSGRPLGVLQLAGPAGAVFQSPSGHVETFGDGAKTLSCTLSPKSFAFAVCEDRFLEKGLLARTILGRGCLLEDAGEIGDRFCN